jgi:N-acetyltransferase 10
VADSDTQTCALLLTITQRYEIADGAPGWADAEKQVLNAAKSGQKNVVVSVKSQKKRKTGETAAEIYEQELGEKVHKKAKKGSKKHHS